MNTDNLVIRQVGTIHDNNGKVCRVKWEGDETESFVGVAELVTLKQGDRFEAMVTRTAWKDQYDQGWKFISMSDVKVIGPLKILTPEESKAIWDRIMKHPK